jgi:hypothetical protein
MCGGWSDVSGLDFTVMLADDWGCANPALFHS